MRKYKVSATVHVGFKPKNPPESVLKMGFSSNAEDAAKEFARRHLLGYAVVSCRYASPGVYRCEAIAEALDYGAIIWVTELQH